MVATVVVVGYASSNKIVDSDNDDDDKRMEASNVEFRTRQQRPKF
jgi:hypothetical protein